VWKTIETDFNDRLYLYYRTPAGSLPVQLTQPRERYVVVQLSSGNYTLATLASEIQTKLINALDATARSFTSFVVSADALNTTLTISMTGSSNQVYFKLFTDAEVIPSTQYWTGYSIDPGNLKSANDIITLVKPMNYNTTMTTGFINLNHINNVYITSPNLGSFDTLSTFSNNIIKKVPVTSPYSFMIVDQGMSTNDFLDCSKQTLRTLEFHLRDGRGNEINLNGMYITFSIVFNKYNLET
jgi:hypothetical protein